MRITRLVIAFTSAIALTSIFVPAASADNLGPENFEGFSTGTVNGQFGWSSLGAAGSGCAVYDHAIDDPNNFGITTLGNRALRISNAVTSGCFTDQTFSPSLTNEAGEPTALNDGLSGGVRQSHFEASWTFQSTVPGSEQSGLSTVVSPDRGDGARMSWVQMTDTPTGVAVNFQDYVDAAPFGTSGNLAAGCGAEDDFHVYNVASGLDRSVAHTIGITMDFVPGPRNDVVHVFVDGSLAFTGGSWEDYYRFCEESNPGLANPFSRTVDSLLFRTGGDPCASCSGYGWLFDGVSYASGNPGPCLFDDDIPTTTRTLLADCVTDHTISVPNGWTLNGDGHTITAIDPTGLHFLGAVVGNAGASANVTNLHVTTAGLADVCDGGADRLRGVLLDGAAGSITNNTVTNIRQASTSGCQEGNGIEVRNAPFDTTGTDKVISITGNIVSGYQKNGITANGSVAATIKNNVVTGDGPVTYIAQNGIQIGFGGTAVVKLNTASGNNYTPTSDVACGFLLFQADGVRASNNTFFANEKNQCNFGKGKGQFNPSP